MTFIFCSAMGYLIGNINPAYLLGRRRGFDIRRRGSDNAGATNATLAMGKAVGLFCALFDILLCIQISQAALSADNICRHIGQHMLCTGSYFSILDAL